MAGGCARQVARRAEDQNRGRTGPRIISGMVHHRGKSGRGSGRDPRALQVARLVVRAQAQELENHGDLRRKCQATKPPDRAESWEIAMAQPTERVRLERNSFVKLLHGSFSMKSLAAIFALHIEAFALPIQEDRVVFSKDAHRQLLPNRGLDDAFLTQLVPFSQLQEGRWAAGAVLVVGNDTNDGSTVVNQPYLEFSQLFVANLKRVYQLGSFICRL
eukprot:Skav216686  [mRNA]  locus=scaffold91:148337:160121:+ [translate_table: standard]